MNLLTSFYHILLSFEVLWVDSGLNIDYGPDVIFMEEKLLFPGI